MTIATESTTTTPSSELTGTAERRRSHRVDVDAPGWLSGESGNPSSPQQEVMVTSLSLSGAGFRGSKELQPGAVHWLVIAAGSLRVSSRARVVRCEEIVSGEFDCGVEFF
jgi:hypothetical protein